MLQGWQHKTKQCLVMIEKYQILHTVTIDSNLRFQVVIEWTMLVFCLAGARRHFTFFNNSLC